MNSSEVQIQVSAEKAGPAAAAAAAAVAAEPPSPPPPQQEPSPLMAALSFGGFSQLEVKNSASLTAAHRYATALDQVQPRPSTTETVCTPPSHPLPRPHSSHFIF